MIDIVLPLTERFKLNVRYNQEYHNDKKILFLI